MHKPNMVLVCRMKSEMIIMEKGFAFLLSIQVSNCNMDDFQILFFNISRLYFHRDVPFNVCITFEVTHNNI